MTTRSQIEAQLRADNPTSTDDSGARIGPGDAAYEALIERWTDAMLASQPASNRKTWPNAAEFLGEFALPQLAAISLSTDPTIAALRLLLAAWPGEVWSDDPQIQAGMAALAAAKILTADESAKILTP